jgi:hypothetical protein
MTAQELQCKASEFALQNGVLCAQITRTPIGFHIELVEANPKNPQQPRRKGIALNDGDYQGPDEAFDAHLDSLVAAAAAEIKKPAFLRRG